MTRTKKQPKSQKPRRQNVRFRSPDANHVEVVPVPPIIRNVYKVTGIPQSMTYAYRVAEHDLSLADQDETRRLDPAVHHSTGPLKMFEHNFQLVRPRDLEDRTRQDAHDGKAQETPCPTSHDSPTHALDTPAYATTPSLPDAASSAMDAQTANQLAYDGPETRWLSPAMIAAANCLGDIPNTGVEEDDSQWWNGYADYAGYGPSRSLSPASGPSTSYTLSRRTSLCTELDVELSRGPSPSSSQGSSLSSLSSGSACGLNPPPHVEYMPSLAPAYLNPSLQPMGPQPVLYPAQFFHPSGFHVHQHFMYPPPYADPRHFGPFGFPDHANMPQHGPYADLIAPIPVEAVGNQSHGSCQAAPVPDEPSTQQLPSLSGPVAADCVDISMAAQNSPARPRSDPGNSSLIPVQVLIPEVSVPVSPKATSASSGLTVARQADNVSEPHPPSASGNTVPLQPIVATTAPQPPDPKAAPDFQIAMPKLPELPPLTGYPPPLLLPRQQPSAYSVPLRPAFAHPDVPRARSWTTHFEALGRKGKKPSKRMRKLKAQQLQKEGGDAPPAVPEKIMHECPLCDRAFERRNGLAIHLKWHYKEREEETTPLQGLGITLPHIIEHLDAAPDASTSAAAAANVPSPPARTPSPPTHIYRRVRTSASESDAGLLALLASDLPAPITPLATPPPTPGGSGAGASSFFAPRFAAEEEDDRLGMRQRSDSVRSMWDLFGSDD